jgi:4-methyl-5(b-hydroxyethyl)-thiazole monophosphate biosynthesis
MKQVLVPLADGFEEIEAVTIVDILRRAGARVTTAGLHKRNVVGSHGIKLVADSVLAEETGREWDLVVLAGGAHVNTLLQDDRLLELVRRSAQRGWLTAAVCAAPAVLERAGVTAGKQVTSHPDWAAEITTARHTGARVVTDGNLITGQAAGSAMEFAFQLVESLFGEEKVQEVNRSVLARIEHG